MSNIKKVYLLCVLGLISTQIVLAQPRNVSGTVTNPQKCPVPGATVRVKGTSNTTLTDLDGKYTIFITGDPATLVFTMPGYLNIEVELFPGQIIVDVEFEEEDPVYVSNPFGGLRFVYDVSCLLKRAQVVKVRPEKTVRKSELELNYFGRIVNSFILGHDTNGVFNSTFQF